MDPDGSALTWLSRQGRQIPQASWTETEACKQERLGVELNLDQLPAFPCGRLPLPLENSVLGRLGKHGMTALDGNGLHRATRGDNDLDLNASLQAHLAGHLWVCWEHSVHNSASAFRSDLSICPAGNHNPCKVENKRHHGDDSPSRGCHVFENEGALMFAKDHFGNVSRIALCFE
jgi:hypothetical protein